MLHPRQLVLLDRSNASRTLVYLLGCCFAGLATRKDGAKVCARRRHDCGLLVVMIVADRGEAGREAVLVVRTLLLIMIVARIVPLRPNFGNDLRC